MTKNKYYAIKNDQKKIVTSWKECQNIVNGTNLKFKGFSNIQDAQNWLDNNAQTLNQNSNADIQAFVDGSYINNYKGYGSGIIILNKNNQILHQKYFRGNEPNLIVSKQIAGETHATLYALNWAITHRYQTILINYDYQGIEKWFRGQWKASSNVSKEYVNKLTPIKKQIQVYFNKIKSHTNNYYNDLADQLAKKALNSLS